MHLNSIAALGLAFGGLFAAVAAFATFVVSMLPVFITILICALGLCGAIFFVVWLIKHNRKPAPIAAPPIIPPQTQRLCPQCRTELAPDAPQGLCPQCLARAAFETQAAGAPDQRNSALPVSEIAKFFPQFEIIELLGQGGMGIVYKARQPQLDRFVALKILSPELSRDLAFAERFAREARALARLNHPNIVAVYESGKAGDFYYLLMEYVDGLNLSQMQAAKKPLAPEEAFAIVPKICEALQYAHDEGVVHRDIKPANILIDKRGRVKIADFGLAKIAGQEIKGLGLTQSRATMGTPQYMAPEQLEKPLEVDHRADIYSLGVVFYEMLTGELPLGRFPVPSKKVQLDVRLDEIVLRTLEKEPNLRYQQASQIKSDVETVVSTPGAQSAPNASAKPAAELTPWWAQPKQIPDWEKWSKIPATPHCSRTAIVGAVWASFLLVLAVLVFGVRMAAMASGPGRPPAWGISLVAIPFLLIGLASPFGTTICGIIAISQIRRSAGKLYGMRLAVFDALLFPMLLLAGVITFVIFLAFSLFAKSPWMPDWLKDRGGDNTIVAIWLLISVVISAIVIYFISRKMWRYVNRPSSIPPIASAATPPPRAFWPIAIMLVVVLIAIAFGMLFLVPSPVRVSQEFGRASSLQRETPSASSQSFAKIRLSVFEEAGSSIDVLIPSDQRNPESVQHPPQDDLPYEVILVNENTFIAVTNAMSRPPGVMMEYRQTVNMWPRQSFSANFKSRLDPSKSGSVVGWMGVRKGTNDMKVRLEQTVSYQSPNSHGYTRVTSEREVPPSAKLLVLLPEMTPDRQKYYLVLAYQIDQVLPSAETLSIVAIGRPDQSPYQWWNTQGQTVTPKEEWLAHSATADLAVIVNRHKIDGMVDVEIKTPGHPRHGGANDTGNNISDVDGVEGAHMRFTETCSAGTGIGEGCTLEYLTDNSSGELRKYLDIGGRVDVIATYGVGKWQEVTKIQPDTMLKTNGGYFRFGKITDLGPTALLYDCIYDFDPDYEISIVGVDKHGRWYRPGDSFGGGQYTSRENRRFNGSIQLPRSQLSNFLVLKRPVTKTIFENIPIRPQSATAPQPSPSASAHSVSVSMTGPAGMVVAGRWIVDGITNNFRATLPTNFVTVANSLAFDVIRQGAPGIFKIKLIPDQTDLGKMSSESEYGIRGKIDFDAPVEERFLASFAQPANTDDLRAKLKLASSMTMITTRDEAMARIAKEAAQARDIAVTRDAIHEITMINVSDSTAAECARVFVKNGMHKEALDLAELITMINVHDDLVKELVQ